VLPSIVSFALFAVVLTITPGLDTMLVLRTGVATGRRAAYAAGLGICTGCLIWATASALGITAILTASEVAYTVLRWAGAAYLCYLGARILWQTGKSVVDSPISTDAPRSAPAAFRLGLTTNLANPKVGVFYLSVLPQFLPPSVNPFAWSMLLAGADAGEGMLWFALLITAINQTRRVLTRPRVKQWLERATGAVFVVLGIRLAGST
jgi:threonine/homoserine/homoserine lactone efflux protein